VYVHIKGPVWNPGKYGVKGFKFNQLTGTAWTGESTASDKIWATACYAAWEMQIYTDLSHLGTNHAYVFVWLIIY
jgi:hypothetical protein